MKDIKIGEKTIRVRATPLALLYYRQEFKADLLGDMAQMEKVAKDPSQFDSVFCLQLTWALAKADAGPGASFPGFENWLQSLEGLDFSDQNWFKAIIEEAADGFFRRGIRGKAENRGT